MAVKIRKGNALSSLSLTPLIDVVFLLLVFFLVTTRFAQEDYELNVVLPSASKAQPLIAEPKSKEEAALNRRVEFHIAKKEDPQEE